MAYARRQKRTRSGGFQPPSAHESAAEGRRYWIYIVNKWHFSISFAPPKS